MIRIGLGRTTHPAAWSAFAAMLAMAGLPIYIHAPKYYVDEYGVSLGALGAVLFALRLIDFAQDPLLGWLAHATAAHRKAMVAGGAAVLSLSMLGLFAVAPPIAPLAWFALTLTGLFSAFSFLTICFYAQGVQKAEAMGADGHVRLAAWREAGALLGVCAAAAAPSLLALGPNPPFESFAILFAAFALGALWVMRDAFAAPADAAPIALQGFVAVLGDRVSRRLLLVALLNAAPVAVSSTLFLFFVESRLQAPGWEGALLILFFLSAALAAPLWAAAARVHGERPILIAAMALSVAAFALAALLGPGDTLHFAAICVVTGAALGADLTLLSALFARRMVRVLPDAATGFALWAFMSKATLALAAISVLPFLEWQGFTGPDSPPGALLALGLVYALVPCTLKLLAIAVLAATPIEREPSHA
ncbi:MAG: MFS/sugar transport protein [Rhodobacteraceae bacterium HLUCCA12]|nr:MAG: MFS/sugar transport protein [Rhodobacteraceae bacterium HLUCCA12]